MIGRLVAQGAIPEAEALGALQRAAAVALPMVDPIACASAVASVFGDAVRTWRAARDRARFAVRRALVPMLAGRLPSWRLLSAAHAVNAAAGLPLLGHEVEQAVRGELARALEIGQASRR